MVENRNDVVDFIWNNISEFEQQNTQGKKWIKGYVEDCGMGVIMAEKSPYDCPRCGSKRNKFLHTDHINVIIVSVYLLLNLNHTFILYRISIDHNGWRYIVVIFRINSTKQYKV